VLFPPRLPLQGEVPGLDDRVIQRGAGPAHRLLNPEALARLPERWAVYSLP
jgi:hypothetical protein